MPGPLSATTIWTTWLVSSRAVSTTMSPLRSVAAIARRAAGEVPPHALGRQLNRRQRILDLMRQPPRDFPPRRHLLRANERRHVVQHEQQSGGFTGIADERRRDNRKLELLALARN